MNEYNHTMTDKQKILIACYEPKEQKLRIPRGLDLEDKQELRNTGLSVEYFIQNLLMEL